MKVLLSIKPEFAFRILEGTKQYEYRRVIFRRKDVKTIVVYASDPVKKVVGEFEIEEVLCEDPRVLWLKTRDKAGMTKERFLRYFGNRQRGYAIKVKAAKTYQPSVPLTELMVSSPPQSFTYL